MNTNTTTSDTNLDILNGKTFDGFIYSDAGPEMFCFTVENEMIVGPKFVPDSPEYNIKDLGSYVFDMTENLIRRERTPVSMRIAISVPKLNRPERKAEQEILFGGSVTKEGFKEKLAESMMEYVEYAVKFLTEEQKTKLPDSDRWDQFQNEPTSNTASQPQVPVADNTLDNIVLLVQADIVNGPSQLSRFFFENNKVLTQYFKSQMDLSAEEVGKFLVSKWGFSFQQKGWTVIFSVKAEHRLSGRIAGFLTDTFVFDTDKPEEENKIRLIEEMKVYVGLLKEQIRRDKNTQLTHHGAQAPSVPTILPVFPGVSPYRGDINLMSAMNTTPYPNRANGPTSSAKALEEAGLVGKLSHIDTMISSVTRLFVGEINTALNQEQWNVARDNYLKILRDLHAERLKLFDKN